MSDLADFAEEEERGRLFEELTANRNARIAKAELRRAVDTIAQLEAQVDLLSAVDDVRCHAPNWKRPPRGSKGNAGIANLLLSDLHLDEVVEPAQMGGVNAYNREIALMRLRRTFERFVVVAQDYVAGINYQGAVVPMLGDIFTGNIHEELARTNEASIIDSVDYWIDPMVAGYRMVADAFGAVHVPCEVGNHGRNTHKPIHKGQVRDNYDWLFYRQVQRALAHDKRFTFDLTDSIGCQHTQYGTTFHYEHGNNGFSGGNGIAGIFSPLMRGDMRLRKVQGALNQPYDVLVLGHFHQYLPVPSYGLIVNGSMKGYDEYARDNKFGFEVPQQAFWVTTADNGVTFSAPILPQDRKKEKW